MKYSSDQHLNYVQTGTKVDTKPCALCLRLLPLCLSHSIPNAFYKLLFKSSNGQAIASPSGRGKLHKTNDSGACLLLCSECEEYLNVKFDRQAINFLKAYRKCLLEGKAPNTRFSTNNLAAFILSVAWRQSVMPYGLGDTYRIPPRLNEAIRQQLQHPSEGFPFNFASFSVKTLVSIYQRGVALDHLSQIIITPICFKNDAGAAIVMVFGGFKFEISFPPLRKVQQRIAKPLVQGRDVVWFSSEDYVKDLRIRNHFARLLKKERNGEITSSVKRLFDPI